MAAAAAAVVALPSAAVPPMMDNGLQQVHCCHRNQASWWYVGYDRVRWEGKYCHCYRRNRERLTAWRRCVYGVCVCACACDGGVGRGDAVSVIRSGNRKEVRW